VCKAVIDFVESRLKKAERLEKGNNQMIYKLYGLTDEEIAIVEGK